MTRHAIAILGMLAGLSACAANEPELMGARAERLDREAEAANQQAGEAQNGATMTLPAGGTLTVRLPGNRTTGYVWAVAERPGNIALASEDYRQDASAPGMVGVGGTEEFVFRATGPGRGALRLEHRAPGNQGVGTRWAITLIVR